MRYDLRRAAVYLVSACAFMVAPVSAHGQQVPTYLREWSACGCNEGYSHAITFTGSDLLVTSAWCVTRYALVGEVRDQWGGVAPRPQDFGTYFGIAVGPDGLIYCTDWGANSVAVFESDGTLLRKWGTSGELEGQLLRPTGITVGLDGLIYVADGYSATRVQRFTSDGTYAGLFCESGRGLATDSHGNIFITSYAGARKFSPSGDLLASYGGTTGDGPGQFEGATGIAIGPSGVVYVVDMYNHRVQAFHPDGSFIGQMGGWGFSPGNLRYPEGIACDALGNVYVTQDDCPLQVFGFAATPLPRTTWGRVKIGRPF